MRLPTQQTDTGSKTTKKNWAQSTSSFKVGLFLWFLILCATQLKSKIFVALWPRMAGNGGDHRGQDHSKANSRESKQVIFSKCQNNMHFGKSFLKAKYVLFTFDPLLALTVIHYARVAAQQHFLDKNS